MNRSSYLALACAALFGCGGPDDAGDVAITEGAAPASEAETTMENADNYDLREQRAKFARIDMAPDTSFLTDEERQVVNLLIQAADLMS